MSISRVVLMNLCFASSVVMAQQIARLPEKVTMLVDAELPVPFATTDAIQSVKAGTEVFLRGVNGEQVKVAHGVGEGYLHHTHTDYAKRAEDVAKNPPPVQPLAPRFKPYDDPIVVERATAEEIEKRATEREQELQDKAEQDRQERERQAERDREKKLRELARKERIDEMEREKKQLDAKIDSERKQVAILKQRQALSTSTQQRLLIAERINMHEGWLKQSELERKNIKDSLDELRNGRP